MNLKNIFFHTSDKEFSHVAQEHIENNNMIRMTITCLVVLLFESLNIFKEDFWESPLVWIGSCYLSLISIFFVIIILLIKKKKVFANPKTLNVAFWILFSVGMFPFLIRDAQIYQLPTNCIILAGILLVVPLFEIKDLNIIFAFSTILNVVAALAAKNFTLNYYITIAGVNLAAYALGVNLHGRYFDLLKKQRKVYDEYLRSRLKQQSLIDKLEKERVANIAKSDFLNRMSHDIRTPMNAIIGLNQLAQSENKNPVVADYLKKMNTSSQFLMGLINDILDMNKIESGHFTLHMQPFPLDDFVASINTVIRPMAEKKNIDFYFKTADGVACIKTDPLRYNQIFFNLLSNAINFTPQGGRIEFTAERFGFENGKIGIRHHVKDNGIGMSKEFLAKIFEPFSQENPAIDIPNQGTGLGMSIVKSIIDAMEGTITVESEPGKGTKFIVDLWVEKTTPEDITQPEKEPFSISGCNILLVEDNPLNTLISVKLLEAQGVNVVTAENGKVALDTFTQREPHTFDAILMDVRMPVMDGLTATKKIRSLDRADAKTIPIIAITANAYDQDRRKSADAGMNAHLSKPIDAHSLYETLANCINQP